MTEASSATESTIAEGQIADGGAQVSDVPAASSTANQDVSAASSTAEGAKGPSSILEAVQTALQKGSTGGASPSTDGGGGKPAVATVDGAQSIVADSEAQDQNLPFHKHPRWQEMKSERDRLRTTNAELIEQSKGYRKSHETLQNLQGYMNEAGLSTQEVNTGFEIMKLMKNDPAGALDALRPYFESLQTVTGNLLPGDLKQAVDQGLIVEPLAREQAQMRGRMGQMHAASEQAAQRAQANLQQQTAGAVSNWEQNWAKSDPDHKLKAPRVAEKVELELTRLSRQGVSLSPQQAVQLADKCRQAVEAEMRQFVPKPQAISSPRATAGSSVGSSPAPKNMLEVVQQAIRR